MINIKHRYHSCYTPISTASTRSFISRVSLWHFGISFFSILLKTSLYCQGKKSMQLLKSKQQIFFFHPRTRPAFPHTPTLEAYSLEQTKAKEAQGWPKRVAYEKVIRFLIFHILIFRSLNHYF